MGNAVPANRRADGDAQLAFAVEAEVAQRPAIGSAGDRFQFIDDFHRPELGCAGDAAARKTGGERCEMGHPCPQAAFHRGNEMLHLRKFFQPGQVRHLHTAEFADLAQIVAQQIGDHHQFSELLGAGLQLVGQLGIAGGIGIPRARAFDRAGDDLRPAQTQELFRRGGGEFKIAAVQEG